MGRPSWNIEVGPNYYCMHPLKRVTDGQEQIRRRQCDHGNKRLKWGLYKSKKASSHKGLRDQGPEWALSSLAS